MTVAGSADPVPTSGPGFLADYEALRTDAGALDLGRDVLRVSGPDALEYLQGQLSQDVGALAVGESAHSLLLSPQGKLDAFVRVSRSGDDELIVDVDAGFGEAVAARLARFKLRVKAVIEPVAWRCVALRGPRAAALAEHEAGRGVRLAPAFSWNGVTGVDLLGEAPEVPDGVRECSSAAWESVRVESGIPVMGAELDERTIAAEADLLDRTVSFTKGCYTGQELVARLDARGNRVARHLRGLVVTAAPATAPGVPEPPGTLKGSEIVSEGKVVGSVTSSAWSPVLRGPVALGYVHRSVVPSSVVELRAVTAGLSGAQDGDDTGDAGNRLPVHAEVRTLPLV